MDQDRSTAAAAALMAAFARRTGLSDAAPSGRRYLWTDAFAVCNFLALARRTGGAGHGEAARGLVERVHHVLGRHRPDDPRQGWLSASDEAAGEQHPTRGGLRIGKPLPERRPDEPFDERLEWERDGQYFHYLTQWMHALDQVARSTGEARYSAWACELARAAHAAFVRVTPDGGRRMAWKMSVDLSRPLVDSMGHHDPLNGLVTCVQLEATARGLPGAPEPGLERAIVDFAAMVDPERLTTVDALGLGGLLSDAGRVAQLGRHEVFEELELLPSLLAAAEVGLAHDAGRGELQQRASRRLAFRELGLAIGLQALPLIERTPGGHGDHVGRLLRSLGRFAGLGRAITEWWVSDEAQRVATWSDHLDINAVMLATSLVPDGYLWLPPVGAGR